MLILILKLKTSLGLAWPSDGNHKLILKTLVVPRVILQRRIKKIMPSFSLGFLHLNPSTWNLLARLFLFTLSLNLGDLTLLMPDFADFWDGVGLWSEDPSAQPSQDKEQDHQSPKRDLTKDPVIILYFRLISYLESLLLSLIFVLHFLRVWLPWYLKYLWNSWKRKWF